MRRIGHKRRKGFRFKQHVDVEIVAAELDKLRIDGALLPQAVVDAASIETSPLHGYFTWDDNEAARLRRLDEARYLIRSVEVVYEAHGTPEMEPVEITTRAFQSTHIHGESQPFMRVEDIMEDPEMRARLVKKAMAILKRWHRNYQGLSEFAGVFNAINGLAIE